ncbi:hypothetical protein [Rudaea sp.]|uniref:hypothetical protein n=1 Tax=Rudaea sp. TaxID=2136325 RepID=UPI002ED5D23B
MKIRNFRFALGLAAVLLAPLSAYAQWSKYADVNEVIGNGANLQVQPKMAPTADGGFYIAWLDNSNANYAGYAMRLQRLDVKGRPQWGPNGIVIANRNASYNTDYGIDVDPTGNALLAFHDLSLVDNLTHVYATKVSPDGRLLWGDASGLIRLPDGGSNGALSPRIVSTGDGGAALGWTVNYSSAGLGRVVLQKLDANGALLWGDQDIQVPQLNGTNFILSDLHVAEDGGVIASWNAQLGRFINQYWTQKYDANGQPMWGSTPHILWDDNAGGAIPNGSFSKFVTDGNGGAVYCWDYTFGVSSRQTRVQHINADGSERFVHNGVKPSTDTVNNRGNCVVSYDAGADNAFVVWRERTPGTANVQVGIYAQRVDGQGNRLWGDTGNALLPVDPIAKDNLVMVPMPNGFVAAWSLDAYPAPMPVQAAYITSDGNYGWSRGIVGIKSSNSGTLYMNGAVSRDGYATFAWTDYFSATDTSVVAQNIGRDGVLGKKDQGATK